MKKKTYIHHTDPGHGWIAVKRNELVELGIADQISNYSYAKGQTVYLEEDGDALCFYRAYESKYGMKPLSRSSYRNSYHPIRQYARYSGGSNA